MGRRERQDLPISLGLRHPGRKAYAALRVTLYGSLKSSDKKETDDLKRKDKEMWSTFSEPEKRAADEAYFTAIRGKP